MNFFSRRAAAALASWLVSGPAPVMARDPASAWSAQDDVRALVAEMMADAETRSSLLQDAATAGHDGRFFMASPDSDFRLALSGQIQFRYIANFRNRGDEPPFDDDFEAGFRRTRTRLIFDGHVFSPKFFYRVLTDFNSPDGDANLQDAWAGYRFDGGWSLRAGQGITSFMREWFTSDQKGFTVERSLQSLIFGQFRSQFVDLTHQSDANPLRAVLTFSDGFRSLNTDIDRDPADYAVTLRTDWRYAGAWKQFEEYRAPMGSEYAGVIGGAIHFEQGPNRPGDLSEQKLLAWTADIMTKGDGWNAMLAGVGYHVTDEAGVIGADFDDLGALAQLGVHATPDLEVIARYDIIIPDRDRAASDTFNSVGAGFNYYLHGHAAKFSFLAAWYLDDTASTTAGNFGGTGARNPTSTIFGVLPSDQPHQVSLMMQVQLLF